MIRYVAKMILTSYLKILALGIYLELIKIAGLLSLKKTVSYFIRGLGCFPKETDFNYFMVVSNGAKGIDCRCNLRQVTRLKPNAILTR